MANPLQTAAARVRQRALDRTLYNPNAVLSGANLRRAVEAIVQGQIAPQRNELKRERSDALALNKYLSDRAQAYDQFAADQLGQGVDRASGLSQALAQRLGSVAQGAQQTLDANQAAANNSLAGVPAGDALARVAANVAASKQDAAARAASIQSAGATYGTNNADVINNLAGANVLAGRERQVNLQNALKKGLTELDAKRADLATTAGGVRAKTLTDLLQSNFEKSATIQGLGLKEADLAQQSANNEDSFLTKYGVSREDWRAMSPKERLAQIHAVAEAGHVASPSVGGDHYGYTTAEWAGMSHDQRIAAAKQWKVATHIAGKGSGGDLAPSSAPAGQHLTAGQNYVNQFLADHPGATRQQIVAHARHAHPEWFKNGNSSQNWLSAALDLRYDKHVSSNNAKILRALGLHVDKNGRPVYK